jgi:hypothetical protein
LLRLRSVGHFYQRELPEKPQLSALNRKCKNDKQVEAAYALLKHMLDQGLLV